MKEIIKNKGTVYCNSGAWSVFNNALEKLEPTKVFIFADINTNKYCVPLFLDKYQHNIDPEIIIVPESEKNKNIYTCLSIWEELTEKGADRNSLIINLGGGVITDLGGFVASTFKRGVPFINIPTSLLAMVDASVGGKNGVNLGRIKNQIGIINNPDLVIIDTQFLFSLPNKQLTSGYAEMLKHGLIHSLSYWNKTKLMDETDINNIETLLWESVLIKNNIVNEDPFEQNIRKTLNYGHTLGHAIESYSMDENTIKPLLHGEAVAIGLILTTYISTKLLNFSNEQLDDITSNILNKFPKVIFNSTAIESILDLLIYDKKNYKGKVLFVLLEAIGKHKINCEVPNTIIYEAFDYYKNYK